MSLMQGAKLYTRTGRFVEAVRVPPFLRGQEADVLVWGSRAFGLTRDPLGGAVYDDEDVLRYTEVFAVWIVDIAPAE